MALRQLNFIKKAITFFFIPQAYTSTNSDGIPLSLLHDYFSLRLITARTLTDDITLPKFYVLVLLIRHVCAATPLSIAVWKKTGYYVKLKGGAITQINIIKRICKNQKEFSNIRNRCFLVALSCLIPRRPNLEVATKRLLYEPVNAMPGTKVCR